MVIAALLYALAVSLIAAGIGANFLRLLKLRASHLEHYAISTSLGFGALGIIVLLLGLAGMLYKSVFHILFLLIFIASFKDIKSFAAVFLNFTKSFLANSRLRMNMHTFLLGILAIFLTLNLIISFAPPWNYDVTAYHAAVPKIYANAHKIIPLPTISYTNLPFLAEYIFTLGFLLSGYELAHLFSWMLAALLVLSIYAFCSRFFRSKTIGMLSAAIFYTLPLASIVASNGFVDMQTALFSFLAFYCIALYFEAKKIGWIAMSAAFAGFAAASKVYGYYTPIGILILLVCNILFIDKSKYSAKAKKILIFGFIALLPLLPMLFKNFIYTGNPVWPLLNEKFHGKFWGAEQAEHFSSFAAEFRYPQSFAAYITLFWDISINLSKFRDDVAIGPIFLAFLPLYFFFYKKYKSNIVNLLIALFFIYLAVWYYLTFYLLLRFFIFALPLAAIASSYVAEFLLRLKWAKHATLLLLVLILAHNFAFWIAANAKEVPVALGIEPKDKFLSKNVGALYDASKFANIKLPKGSITLFFKDNRGYYFDRDYIWADPLRQGYINFYRLKDENELYSELKRLKVTHVLFNKKTTISYEEREYTYSKKILDIMDKFLERHTIPIYNKDGIGIYEIK